MQSYVITSQSALQDLSPLKRWVAYSGAPKGGKLDKAPVSPKTGRLAQNDNPATWGTREAAEARAEALAAPDRKPGVGVQLGDLGDGTALCGIDLDGCGANPAGWAQAICERFGTYAEVSPSGEGVKLFFRVRSDDLPAVRKAMGTEHRKVWRLGEHHGAELHLSNSYFTVTGRALEGHGEALRLLPASDLLWLIKDHAPAILAQKGQPEDSPSGGDESGSGVAFKAALDLARHGMGEDEARDALAEDQGAAGEWWGRAGERQQDRCIANAFARVAEERARVADSFDDAPEVDWIDDFLDGLTAPTAKPKASRLTFLTPGECASLPARDYLVKGLVAPGQVGAIFGDPGAGKSLIAPRLAYAIAQGAEAFGLRTRQGGVFYVACEDEAGMAGRVAALHADLGEAPDFRLVCGCSDLFSPGQIEGKGSPDFEALRQAIKAQKPKLIVLDTLAMAMPGLEENDAAGMNRVVQIGKELARHGAAVIFIHHGTKAEGNTPRGHSVFNGALDFSIQVRAADQSGIVRGQVRKNRNGPADLGIAFRIGTRHVGTDVDGEPVNGPICEPLDPVDAQEAGPRLSPAQRAAFALVHEMAGTSGQVPEVAWREAAIEGRAVSGVEDRANRRKAVSRALQALAQAGLVRVADGVIFLAQMESMAACFDAEGFGDDEE